MFPATQVKINEQNEIFDTLSLLAKRDGLGKSERETREKESI
jgi:hypothetical protein